jgi:radical SAM superfamily enzyme YgiQ (UPF0313 family)
MSAPSLVVVDGESGSPSEVREHLEGLAKRFPSADLCLATGVGRDLSNDPDSRLTSLRYVLRGEAEPALGELLQALRMGRREFSGVHGLDWRDRDGVLHREPDRPLTLTPTAHPEPAWDLCPDALRERLPRGFAPWLTSWTCPPTCPTCHGSFGRSVRVRDRDHALAEARRVLQEGARGLGLLDEVFDHDVYAAKALLRGLLQLDQPTRLVFARGLRAEAIDLELATLLYSAGLRRVDVPIRTASPRLQKLLHEHRDMDATRRSVAHLVRAGIFVSGTFLVGAPGEDAVDRRATCNFARRSGFHQVRYRTAGTEFPANPRGHTLPRLAPKEARRACIQARIASAWAPSRALRVASWTGRRLLGVGIVRGT